MRVDGSAPRLVRGRPRARRPARLTPLAVPLHRIMLARATKWSCVPGEARWRLAGFTWVLGVTPYEAGCYVQKTLKQPRGAVPLERSQLSALPCK